MSLKIIGALGFLGIAAYAVSQNVKPRKEEEEEDDWDDYERGCDDEDEDGEEEDEEEEEENQLEGGIGDETDPDELDQEELAMGEKVELEHTTDPAIAKEIATDHLTEDPKYYTHLKEMEEKARRILKKAR